MKRQLFVVGVLFACAISGCADNSQSRTPFSHEGGDKTRRIFTNSLGMRMVPIEPGGFMMGESAAPLLNELTRNLSYPQRAELVQKFPNGDPDKFAITVEHVRNGDFDENPRRMMRPLYSSVGTRRRPSATGSRRKRVCRTACQRRPSGSTPAEQGQ
jgi:formylglycine-generating enzyme required for sulfatase activity